MTIGGHTVAELKQKMSRPEFLRWKAFYVMYPFDDLHRYHRPAAMVATSIGGGGGDLLQARLDYLAPDPMLAGLSEADRRTVRAFPGAIVKPAPRSKAAKKE